MSESIWPSDDDWEPTDDPAWRGDLHPDEAWPECLAGPEYWLYKEQQEREEGDNDGPNPGTKR